MKPINTFFVLSVYTLSVMTAFSSSVSQEGLSISAEKSRNLDSSSSPAGVKKLRVMNKFFDPIDDEFRVDDNICKGERIDVQLVIRPESQFMIAYLDYNAKKNIEMTVGIDQKAVFSVDLHGSEREIEKSGSEDDNDEAEDDDREQIRPELDHVKYIIIKPSMLKEFCSSSCNVTLSITRELENSVPSVVENPYDFEHVPEMQKTVSDNSSCADARFVLTAVLGKMIQFSEPIRNAARMLHVKRYGIEINESSLNVLIEMTPEPRFTQMDLDLYLYHESDLFSYVFPNSDVVNRNYRWNLPEYVFLGKSSSLSGKLQSRFKEGFYLLYVFAPVNPEYDLNLFELAAYSKYSICMFYFQKMTSKTGFLAATIFLVFSIFWIVKSARLRAKVHSRKGASLHELSKIPLINFYTMKTRLDENEVHCAICLEQYQFEDVLRDLLCGHHFHQLCVDSWLSINKTCPLCKQTPFNAVDMHRRSRLEN